MNDLLVANILRGIVTSILNIILMFSLAELKYSKKFTFVALSLICVLIMVATSYFYIYHDLTTLAKVDVIIWILGGLSCQFLSTDSVVKWLFNVITAINILFFVVIVSYIVSRYLPYPMYFNTVIRIVLYSIFIILFKKFVYNFYRHVVHGWQQLLLVALGIMINFTYIFITSKDIAKTIAQNATSMLLMLSLMFLAYITMFWLLVSIKKEYEFRTEKEQIKLYEEFLHSQLSIYKEFVEAAKRNYHDLRHHNQIILQYLQCTDIEGAKKYLCVSDANIEENNRINYCRNYIANAVLSVYSQKAQVEKIAFVINANIPEYMPITLPELGSMLSNILENALEACKIVQLDNRFIKFIAEVEDDSLKIEIKNTKSGEVEIRNNLPVSTKHNGGTGLRSVKHIVEHYKGMLDFSQERDIFIVRIILPV